MPFFGREDRKSPAPRDAAPAPRPASPPAPAAPPARRTMIAAGLRITGKVTGSEVVRIHGEVDGEVLVDGSVVIGPEGLVHGRVEARQVTVEGRLEGNLLAGEKAEVTASGQVEGDIEAPRVVIAEGAYFKGNVKMGQPSSAGRPRPPAGGAAPAAREGSP